MNELKIVEKIIKKRNKTNIIWMGDEILFWNKFDSDSNLDCGY